MLNKNPITYFQKQNKSIVLENRIKMEEFCDRIKVSNPISKPHYIHLTRI